MRNGRAGAQAVAQVTLPLFDQGLSRARADVDMAMKTNQVNAQYDLQNAKARLDRAVGRYAFTGTTSPGLPAPPPSPLSDRKR